MLRWIWRLSTSGLQSDLRWLLPVMVCTGLTLGAFLPVFGIVQTVRSGALQYLRQTLGADVRANLNSVPGASQEEKLATLVSLLPEGTRCVVGRSVTTGVMTTVANREAAPSEAVAAAVLLLDEPGYPCYGGGLWTVPPEEALETGVVLTAGLAEALDVRVGDSVTLFGRALPVTGLSPDSLLTIADVSNSGQIVALRSVLLRSGVDDAQLSQSTPLAFLSLPPGASLDDANNLTRILVDSFGREGMTGLGDVAPLVTSGLDRLSGVFFWVSLIVLFICAFGIAFGLEDYARSHSLETAILRSCGASSSQVALIMAVRLVLVGLATSVLTCAMTLLLRRPLGSLFGLFAKDLVDLSLPRTISWPLLLMGPVLIIVYGFYAFRITLGLKPFAILRQKAAGFPLLGRAEQSAWSAFTVIVVTLILTPFLQKLLLGASASLAPALFVLAFCLAVFLVVYLGTALVDRVGRSAPAGVRWALTYVRLGRARSVITMAAATIALGVGVGAILLDQSLTSELEQAIERQIPASTLAYYPMQELTEQGEADLVREISTLESVQAVASGGIAVMRVVSSTVAGGDHGTTAKGTLVVKLVDPDHAKLFGSDLSRAVIDQAKLEPGEIPCSLIEEYAAKTGLSVGDSIDVRPSMKTGGTRRLRIVSIEPYVGVRAGLLAAASAPNSLLPADFGVVVVRGDPSRGADVEGVIRSYVPGGTVYDLGAIELVLRSLSRQLGFLWRVCAILSLLVALAVCFSAASIANVRRTAELALFRALGASTRQTYAGPVAEVLTQGLLCGLAGGGLVQVGFLSAIGFVFGVEVPIDAAVLAGSVVVSLVIAVLMQIISVRRSLKLSPLQVLRND